MNKVALVTGGGGGIGTAVCQHLAEAGYRVVVNYRSRQSNAQETLESLAGDGHVIYQASVTERPQLEEMAKFVAAEYGRLDLLVNNAGMTKPVAHDDLDGLDDAFIDRLMATNFRGAFGCIRAFRPLLEAGEGGTVINMSSIAARTGVGSNVAYCASKAAMDSMTRSLARSLAPKIRVVSLAPGWVWGEYASRFSDDYIQEQIGKTPLARIAQADDIGRAAVAIAEHLTFSTGCIIPVDGGRPLL